MDKFDQTTLPSALEMGVGRIDFANMPAFAFPASGISAKSEIDLLKQYFEKNHRYRLAQITFPDQLMVGGYYSGAAIMENNDIYVTAAIHGTRWFGMNLGNLLNGDFFISEVPCLFGLQVGFGSGNSIYSGTAVPHTTQNIADQKIIAPIAFAIIGGSYFCDWNWDRNNFLRAILCQKDYGLVAMWSRYSNWQLDTLALGDTFADGIKYTVQNDFKSYSSRTTYIMGDSTLRTRIIPPVSGLNTAVQSNGNVTINWSAISGARYLVYRSAGSEINSASRFIRISANPLEASQFIDSTAPSGPKVYQVKRIETSITGSGAYTNLSTGVFIRVN